MNKPTVCIIGFGRTGRALSASLKDAGYEVEYIYKKGDRITSLSDITFITTPDSEIRKVSFNLSNQFEDLSGKSIFHCSGLLSSSVLESVTKKGATIGCFHPLVAISSKTKSFKNVYFDLEGPKESLLKLEQVASDIGAYSFVVTPKEKELLHVSAVMASNYLVTITDLALRISASSSISERALLNSMIPLMKSSLQNMESQNPSEALTGPISRGDIQTVQKHIKLLEDNEEVLDVYKKLGLLTLELIGDDLKDNTIKFRLYDLLK